MGRYLLARIAWAVPIVLAILVINFLIIHVVPGDPVQALVGDFPTPAGYVEQVRQEFGLDRPIAHQLGLYLWNLAQGNLGFSFANRQAVLGLILDRARLTLLLMLPSLTLAAVLGIVLAMAAAPRAGSIYDSAITALSLIGYSMPVFWLGQLLVILFAIKLRWLPAQGMITLRNTPTGWAAVGDVVWHLALPALSVTIYYVAVVARVARASVLATISQDYVLTARATTAT
jgi:peptide/nickel transport system permease protein